MTAQTSRRSMLKIAGTAAGAAGLGVGRGAVATPPVTGSTELVAWSAGGGVAALAGGLLLLRRRDNRPGGGSHG